MVYPGKYLVHLVRRFSQVSPTGGGASVAIQEVFPTKPERETAANSKESLSFKVMELGRGPDIAKSIGHIYSRSQKWQECSFQSFCTFGT